MKKPSVSRDLSSFLAKVNVLVIDSDEKMVKLMTETLENLGFTVYGAFNGFHAMKLLEKYDIDLIITDWELSPNNANDTGPNPASSSNKWGPALPTDGDSLVRYIRASKSSPNPYLSIMMLTGQALRDSVEYARDAGVNEILIKPISADNLCSRIVRIVNDSRPFVTSKEYKGPCRRNRSTPMDKKEDRRKLDIKIVRSQR